MQNNNLVKDKTDVEIKLPWLNETKLPITCLQIIYPAMKTNQGQIDQTFIDAIDSLLAFEQTCSKAYIKLSKIALAPELGKALDPEQTNIKNHVQRLKVIKKIFGIKSANLFKTLSINIPKFSTKKTAAQDLTILSTVLQLQEAKISQYHFLFVLSKAIHQTLVTDLLDQCISENRDTNTWIKRILDYSATEMLK